MKKKRKKSKSTLFKVIGLVFLIILIIAISILTISYKMLSSKVNRVDINRDYVTNVQSESSYTDNKTEDNIINIALLGSDYSQGFGAADSTIILSINTKNNKIKLLSLMRDIYLDLPDGGKSNLNYTLNSGGPELILRTINYNFSLNIDKFIYVNLSTLPKIIDKLGGVEINITPQELQYINGYISNIDKENGTTTEPITSAGTQLLNGTQASAYCRIRYTEGRDFKRTERQRDVLSALFNKFKNISITEVPGIISDLLPLVTTNMTDGEMLSIASKALKMNISNIEQGRFPLDGDFTTEWTDMYHQIIDLDATRNAIHQFINN